jgi:acyl-CoA thioesterase
VSDFDETTAVEPLGEGRYRASMTSDWNGTLAPNGGMLAATVVRAVQAEAGEDAPPIRIVSAQYLDAPVAGAVEIVLERQRGGRRVAAYAARIVQDGRLMVSANIVCSAAREASITRALEPPEAPAPAEVAVLEMPPSPMRPVVFERLEMRRVFGELPLAGAGEALAGGWMSIRGDDRPLDAARLVALCDLWWPAIFPVLRAPDGAPTLQLTVFLRDTGWSARPPVLARFQTRTVTEGHFEERGVLFAADGRLLAESVQLALLLPLGG